MRFFKKSLIVLVATVFSSFAIITSFNGVVLYACDTVEECEAKQAEIKAKKEEKEAEIANNKSAETRLSDEVISLGNQIISTEAEIVVLEDMIKVLVQQVIEKEAEIAVKEEKVSQRLVVQQKQNNKNTQFALLASSTSLTDLMKRWAALEKYNELDYSLIKDLREIKLELEQTKQQQETSKQTLENKTTELKELKTTQENALVELRSAIAKAEEDYNGLVTTEEEINKQKSILENKVPSSNGWYLPAASGILTCGIGCYPDHIGIDFGMVRNTEIYSVATGVVVYTQSGYGEGSSGYGNMVAVSHVVNGVPHVSIYGHLKTILVSVGDVVSGGETIALSGNTGTSTGPHLHLEIIRNIEYFTFDKNVRRQNFIDPLDVLPQPNSQWYW